MGAYIFRQPNGLLGRYSTVADGITHYDMTEEDYVEVAAQIAADQARWEARRLLEVGPIRSIDDVKEDFWPTNQSVEDFERCLSEMGDSSGLSEKKKKEIESWYQDLESLE